jgi:hypothetical protein
MIASCNALGWRLNSELGRIGDDDGGDGAADSGGNADGTGSLASGLWRCVLIISAMRPACLLVNTLSITPIATVESVVVVAVVDVVVVGEIVVAS